MIPPAHVFRLLAVTLLLVMSVAVLKERRRGWPALATLAFFLTLLCYLSFPELTGRPGEPQPAWAHLMLAGRNAVPFTFWLLSKAYFEDEFRPRPVHGLLLIVQLGVHHAATFALAGQAPFAAGSDAEKDLWVLASHAVSALLVLHALFGIYAGHRSDLVEARIRLRRPVLLVTGSYALLVLVGEVLLRRAEEVRLADLLNSGAIFLLLLAFSALLLRLEPELLRGPRPEADAPAADPKLVERLRELLETAEIFKEEGLTIGALAERLGVPEYKLRRLINAQLGFRNFNAFLNEYRIRQAKAILRDPKQRHLSVAEIAYALGYRSLGPFNKAFKELTAETPTEFRRRGLG